MIRALERLHDRWRLTRLLLRLQKGLSLPQAIAVTEHYRKQGLLPLLFQEFEV